MSLRNSHALIAVAVTSIAAVPGASAQVYVWQAGDFAPNGTFDRPYQLVQHAACAAPAGSQILISPGDYRQPLRITDPCRLTANGGLVRLGADTSTVTTNLRVVSYNTHLFGNTIDGVVNALQALVAVIPGIGGIIALIIEGEVNETAWADNARAFQVGLRMAEENADLVCLQEVWDTSLRDTILAIAQPPNAFYGGYRAPSYVDLGPFGEVELGYSLNSGLLVMSDHQLMGSTQTPYAAEDGFIESVATKSYVQTSIVKDGITIGVFNTHTQSGDDTDEDVVTTRDLQMFQLAIAISLYRISNPSNPVVIVGDMNVNGNNWLLFSEYIANMRETLTQLAPLRDTAANMQCVADWARCTSCTTNELHNYFYPDNHASTRLDYAFYCDSFDGTTKIRPTSYAVRDYEATFPISSGGFSARDLSDHYGVVVDFEISR